MEAIVDITRVKLEQIAHPFSNSIKLYMLRLDLIDDEISGNKWFKLKHNIANTLQENKTQLITFGGAFSNHIAATAKACYLSGIKSIGIIRGEQATNQTLTAAARHGMELHFVSRALYRDKQELNHWLVKKFDLNESLVIPEGGANEAGIEGAKEIISLIDVPFDFIALACGTGTTLAGVVQQLKEQQHAIGFSALKGGEFLRDEINKVTGNNYASRFSIMNEYHFGGYAKFTPALLSFMEAFHAKTNIQLDFVYTAKLVYGLFDKIQQNYFPEQATIVVIHSGGLQGNKGIGI